MLDFSGHLELNKYYPSSKTENYIKYVDFNNILIVFALEREVLPSVDYVMGGTLKGYYLHFRENG